MPDAPDPPDDARKLRVPPRKPPWAPRAAIALLALGVAAVMTVLLSRSDEIANPYLTAPVTRASITKEVRASGHLELTTEVTVPAPLSGQLLETLVKPGDLVDSGQPLARLGRAPAEMAIGVASAELNVVRARVAESQAAERKAAAAAKRTERLAARGLASASEVEAARTGVATARAALRAARAKRDAAEKRLAMRVRDRDRTDIAAPSSGLVLEVPRDTGAFVTLGQPLFRIGAPPDEMHVEALVGETDIGEIELGQKASFDVPAHTDRVFEASVSHINPDPQMDAGAVFYRVTLNARNSERLLLPGMTAQVRVKVAEVEDVLAVREAALRFTPAGAPPKPPRSIVWRLRGDALHEIAVEPGLSDGALTEVRSVDQDDLAEDAQIVIGVNTTWQDGEPRPSLSLRGSK